VIVPKGDRLIPSPTIARVLADLRRADDYLMAGRFSDAISQANQLATQLASSAPHVDVVLVASTLERPLRTTETSFEPGSVRGRVYVYDFATHHVKCAGEVQAASSRQVEYSSLSLAASLDEDFDLQIERAIARSPLFGTK
jgi:hypothetical protein